MTILCNEQTESRLSSLGYAETYSMVYALSEFIISLVRMWISH